jgi:hypothetical protein
MLGVSFSLPEPHRTEEPLMDKKEPIRIELTEEQKKLVRDATGKDASAIELTAEELEERVSPGRFGVEDQILPK